MAGLLKGEDLQTLFRTLVEKYDAEVKERGIYGVDEDLEFFLAEQKALLAGILSGWQTVRLPALLAEYEVIAVEQEVEWPIAPGIHQMLRCDALLRRKSDGLLFILEFKTVATPGYQWQNQWEHNIQILSYCAAVEETRNEPVGGVMIEGLVKGMRRKETAQSSPFFGRTLQTSPFCYTYETEVTNGDVLRSWEWSKKAKKIQLSWQEWLEGNLWMMDPSHLSEQFIVLPAITPIRSQMDRWRRQTISAEVRWAMAMDEIAEAEGNTVKLAELLDFHAPQHDNHCLRYGSPCSFMDICFNSLVEDDPIGSGLYQQRRPHHDTEIANG